ncbi:MAG: glycosyltransferase family 4 protein [Candidatus Latescibacterota bacterium]|nr:glycosyltransferase family 4 protein [Candidatus Latescibacterota bacterium]MEC8646340.1 glycosyltransferase family 4 protein [Candidatus Latescibacterota bacterium]
MRICMVAFSDLRFDYRIFREATSLHEAGHSVTIIAAAFSNAPLEGWDAFDTHLITVDRRQSLRLLYPLFWHKVGRILKGVEADAYHAHDLDALWPTARAARRNSQPLVYDSHEFWTEQSSLVHRPIMRSMWSRLEKALIPQVDHAITVSPSIAHSLQARYPSLGPVTVLRNLPLYKPHEENDLIRQTLGIAPDRPVVLYQGGFLTANGLQEQIKAAKYFNNAAFVLIGDGPCGAELKDLVRQMGLEYSVYFIDRVPFHQLHAYTCSADLGLCLIRGTGQSFYYSLPNKLFEYMMGGLPVLASNFPEMQRIVEETGAGAVTDPEDVEAISKAVYALLSDSAGQQTRREAALRAAQRFNWECESKALTDLYNKL